MNALASLGALGSLFLLILAIALIIAPLYIWEHTKQHRREARAAAKQAHDDAQAILIAITKLTNALYDAAEPAER